MNTGVDSNPKQREPATESDDVDTLIRQGSECNGSHDAKAEKQVNDEQAKADRKDFRKEMWVVGGLILISIVDGVMFSFIENWSAPLVIGILQLFAALIFAKNFGVTEIQLWLTQLLERFPNHQAAKVDQQHDSSNAGKNRPS